MTILPNYTTRLPSGPIGPENPHIKLSRPQFYRDPTSTHVVITENFF